MNSEDFDDLLQSQPFGTADVARWEADLRTNNTLFNTLGLALWGKTSEDAQRQLLLSHPVIPPGFDLADLQKLLQWTIRLASAGSAIQRIQGLPPVMIGPQHLTLWRARLEILRRAINYLGN